MCNTALTLGETATQFYAETDCPTVYAVRQHSDLASVNGRHKAVTHHCCCVAVAGQDLHKQVTFHDYSKWNKARSMCGY